MREERPTWVCSLPADLWKCTHTHTHTHTPKKNKQKKQQQQQQQKKTLASREKIGTSRVDINWCSPITWKQHFCPAPQSTNKPDCHQRSCFYCSTLQRITFLQHTRGRRHAECLRYSMLNIIVSLEHRYCTLGFLLLLFLCVCVFFFFFWSASRVHVSHP